MSWLLRAIRMAGTLPPNPNPKRPVLLQRPRRPSRSACDYCGQATTYEEGPIGAQLCEGCEVQS